ncbi:MAG: chemotaxis protein CheW [Leptolyngbyaceae cyanobacterium]
METSYCLFEINEQYGAVQATYVEEVLSLPEIVLIPNAPLGILGVIDLRGDTVPIVDLRLADETQAPHYRLTDSVIILQQTDLRIGIIVNAVKGIRELSGQDLTVDLEAHQASSQLHLKRFFAGVISEQTDIFILNTPHNWFKTGEIQQVMSVTRFLVDEFYDSQTASLSSGQQAFEQHFLLFAPMATLEEKIVFRQRAENLRQSHNAEQPVRESRALITISLDGNLFGIDSNLVREFITINQATPIPCCPKHIIGAINLRGEILVVVDIAKSLGLSLKALPRAPKAIIVELEDTLVAIIVEDIRDALFSADLNDIEELTNSSSTDHSYAQGTVPYGDQIMQILDIPALLGSRELVVNEIL